MQILPLVLAQSADETGAKVGLALGAFFIVVWITIVAIFLAGFIFWIWTIIDCARREFPQENDKLLWILIIVLLGVLGSIIYVIVGRKKGTLPGKSNQASAAKK